MQIEVFKVPVENDNNEVEEINKFLRNNRIVDVIQQFVTSSSGSFWCFCIKYLHSNKSNDKKRYIKKEKVDYKEILNEEDFKKFSKLREIRKELSKSEAIPAYAIFTDKELVEIIKLKEISFKGLKTVNGIGENKIEKYGERFIEKLTGSSEK